MNRIEANNPFLFFPVKKCQGTLSRKGLRFPPLPTPYRYWMKAEIKIDSENLINEISQKVIKAIKPLFGNAKAEADTILTVKTLAKYIEVSDQWVYERVHLKEIPFIKIGKFPRFRKSDIDQWLDSLKTPALNRPPTPIKVIKW